MITIKKLNEELKNTKLRSVKRKTENNSVGHKKTDIIFNFYNSKKLSLSITEYLGMSIVSMLYKNKPVDIKSTE